MSDLPGKIAEIVKRGRAENPNFDEDSAYVVGMSKSLEEVQQALAALGDDAHHVVGRLAEEPDEAARILGHTGRKLGAELGKFAGRTPPKAAPAIKANEQPKPPPAPNLYDSKLSTRDWAKEYDRQQAEKRQKRLDAAKADAALFSRKG